MVIHSRISSWDLAGKSVFLRTDYNVPLMNGIIQDSYRLDATIPTLAALRDRGARITIGTHIGRPPHPDPAFSTHHLIPWFTQHGFDVIFQPDLKVPVHPKNPRTIVLLENLRFWPEEQHPSLTFAQQLARGHDFYVNDSFGTLQNNDTSTTLLPLQFSFDHRSIGFVIEKEIAMLTTLMKDPQRPFIAILGGSKVAEKLTMLAHLIEKIDTLMLCPALVFTFLKARGIPVGTSFIDEKSIPLCTSILARAHALGKKIMFPLDYYISPHAHTDTLTVSATIPSHTMGITIGPRTVEAWKIEIEKAETIFFNGAMGFLDKPTTLGSIHALFEIIAHAHGTSCIAGGDSVAIAHRLGIRGVDHLSIGGGAAIALLSNQQLPGLVPFTSKDGAKS